MGTVAGGEVLIVGAGKPRGTRTFGDTENLKEKKKSRNGENSNIE